MSNDINALRSTLFDTLADLRAGHGTKSVQPIAGGSVTTHRIR